MISSASAFSGGYCVWSEKRSELGDFKDLSRRVAGGEFEGCRGLHTEDFCRLCDTFRLTAIAS